MAPYNSGNKMFSIALGGMLILNTVLFAVRTMYEWQIRLLLGLTLFAVTWGVAWKAGAFGVCSADKKQRQLALAGMLLIGPWTLFAFLIGIGTPDVASPAENQLRYLVLTINASLVVGGLIMLRQSLSDVNERLYSTLGLWATILVSAFYLGFTSIALVESRAIERSPDLRSSLEFRMFDELSLTFLYFGALFTYGATAAFASSMTVTGTLTKSSGRTFRIISLVFLLLVAVHMSKLFWSVSGPMWSFENWYAIPGQILAIPAVPWILLGVFGVLLLRRASAVAI